MGSECGYVDNLSRNLCLCKQQEQPVTKTAKVLST